MEDNLLHVYGKFYINITSTRPSKANDIEIDLIYRQIQTLRERIQ
jgi:hypothetical protein